MNTTQPTNELFVSMAKANLYSMAFALPATFFMGGLYSILWGIPALKQGLFQLFDNLFISLAVLIGGVVVHELLHGLSWAYFGNKPLRTIKFGFQWKTFTPYAHSREPLEIRAYRIGAAMPGLVLGIIPSSIALIIGTPWLAAFGLFYTLVAGGDMLILWLIRHVKAGQRVADHPTHAGCYVLD